MLIVQNQYPPCSTVGQNGVPVADFQPCAALAAAHTLAGANTGTSRGPHAPPPAPSPPWSGAAPTPGAPRSATGPRGPRPPRAPPAPAPVAAERAAIQWPSSREWDSGLCVRLRSRVQADTHVSRRSSSSVSHVQIESKSNEHCVH